MFTQRSNMSLLILIGPSYLVLLPFPMRARPSPLALFLILSRRWDRKHGNACNRIEIRPLQNIGHSRNIWNSNNLTPRMQARSCLIRSNLVPWSRKSLNESRVIDICFMDKLLSAFPVNLACIIIYYMRDTANTSKSKRVFSFPLLLTDIFIHFHVDLQVSNRKLHMPQISYLACPSFVVDLSIMKRKRWVSR